MQEKKSPVFSLSSMIFFGFGLGIVTGLFFGDMVSWMKSVGDVYINLLQMTVLPYVIVSLVIGLGSLDYRQAVLLARKGGSLLLLIWSITLAVVFLFPLAFPNWQSASFFSTALVQSREPIDFIKLYIPANPFHSLANNMVPAVVLFSMAIGLALIGIKEKSRIMEDMNTLMEALTRVTNFVVRLTPLGVFAITASASGTMNLADIERMAVYLVTYVAFSLAMSFYILPALVTTLTPLKYRQVLGLTKDALITAFATSSLFIILPILAEKSKEMVSAHAADRQEAESAVDVVIAASFNFPHAGKLFTLSFVLFAGWYSGFDVDISNYPVLIGSGLVSLFASVTVAVPFMLDLVRIPSDTFQFFIATSVINARFGTLLAAVHVLALTLLTASSMSGQLKVQWWSLLRYILFSCLLLAAVITGSRFFLTTCMSDSYAKDKVISSLKMPDHQVVKTLFKEVLPPSVPPPVRGERLRAIRERHELRVCYEPENVPFSYLNADGELVGLDIELLEILAADLKVSIIYVPHEFSQIDSSDSFDRGYCDIGVGQALNPELALKQGYSASYMDYTVGFLVKDYKRNAFSSLKQLLQHQDSIVVALSAGSYYERHLRDVMPWMKTVQVASIESFVKQADGQADGMITSAERAAAWSVLYPEYAVTTPFADSIKIPKAFPVPKDEEELTDFLEIWIALKKKDGTVATLYNYWVLSQGDIKKPTRRWSIIRNVLHWVK